MHEAFFIFLEGAFVQVKKCNCSVSGSRRGHHDTNAIVPYRSWSSDLEMAFLEVMIFLSYTF